MAIRLTVLGSGSGGNATCIEGAGVLFLLDAGFSCREITARLQSVGIRPSRLDAVLITHEHVDHVRGAAAFAKAHRVPIYCTRSTARVAELDERRTGEVREIAAGVSLPLRDLTVTFFSVPHDATDTLGCTIEDPGARIGYATDLGHASESVQEALKDCDLLVLESNHDVEMLRTGPYPPSVKRRLLSRHGHLDNATAASLACAVATNRTRRIIMAHLSRTNNRPDLAIRAMTRRFEDEGRRPPSLHPVEQGAPSPWFEA